MSERWLRRFKILNQEEDRFENTPKISTKQLGVPQRVDLGEGLYDGILNGVTKSSAIKYYHDLERSLLRPSRSFDTKSQTVTYSVECPHIDGGGINALLYYTAPNKFYGFDTLDILGDWKDIFEKKNTKRLKSHSRLKNWDTTVEQINIFRNAILEWFNNGLQLNLDNTQDNVEAFSPVIKWERRVDGDRNWKIDKQAEPNSNALLGIYFAAAFSYDTTSHWPQYMGYNETDGTQPMGTTQTVHLAVMKSGELFRGKFMQNLEAYVDNAVFANSV